MEGTFKLRCTCCAYCEQVVSLSVHLVREDDFAPSRLIICTQCKRRWDRERFALAVSTDLCEVPFTIPDSQEVLAAHLPVLRPYEATSPKFWHHLPSYRQQSLDRE